jgi:hypothetical protein
VTHAFSIRDVADVSIFEVGEEKVRFLIST